MRKTIRVLVVMLFNIWTSSTFATETSMPILTFEPIASPQIAGIPFNIRVSCGQQDIEMEEEELLLDEPACTLEPMWLPQEDIGKWAGTVSLKRAGTTCITATRQACSYGKITSQSNHFLVLPSLPAKVIVVPQKELRLSCQASVLIRAVVLDEFNNPINGAKCRLGIRSLLGPPGTLSATSSITDKKGVISASYTLPTKFHRAKIEVAILDSPGILATSGTITTKPSIRSFVKPN